MPYALAEKLVWARPEGDELVVVHVGPRGAAEVARHDL
jgi:hypothetical protein